MIGTMYQSINQSINQYLFIWRNDITTDTNAIEIYMQV